MKTNFFKVILPAAVITLGIAGAMSTHAMSKKAMSISNKMGYTHIVGQNCVATNITCRTEAGSPCKSGANLLYDFVSTTSCPVPLNKIP